MTPTTTTAARTLAQRQEASLLAAFRNMTPRGRLRLVLWIRRPRISRSK